MAHRRLSHAYVCYALRVTAVLLLASTTAALQLGVNGTLANRRSLGDVSLNEAGSALLFHQLPFTDCATYTPPVSAGVFASFSPACCVQTVAECAARCVASGPWRGNLGTQITTPARCTGSLDSSKSMRVCAAALNALLTRALLTRQALR